MLIGLEDRITDCQRYHGTGCRRDPRFCTGLFSVVEGAVKEAKEMGQGVHLEHLFQLTHGLAGIENQIEKR